MNLLQGDMRETSFRQDSFQKHSLHFNFISISLNCALVTIVIQHYNPLLTVIGCYWVLLGVIRRGLSDHIVSKRIRQLLIFFNFSYSIRALFLHHHRPNN